jgi:uncharacterized protein (DUF433 family)
MFVSGSVFPGIYHFFINIAVAYLTTAPYNLCMQPTLTPHVEVRPDKCGGKPCVAGTRIRVWDVYVLHERLGKTPDEIQIDYPELSLADVHAALAYYFDHQAEIDAQMKAADDFVDQIKALSGPGPLTEKHARRDSISS